MTTRRFDELLDDGKADPGSAARLVARLVDTIEPLEDPRQVGGRNPLAGVGDLDENVAGPPRSR